MNDDLISRQMAIDALDKRFDSIPMNQTTEILLLRKDLRELPSAQPGRKRGKWINVNGRTVINCSACYHCSWSLSFKDTVKRFNFCPHCGADMREVDDETD